MFTKALGLATAFASLTSALPHVARASDSTSSPTVSPTPSSSGSPSGGGVTIKNNLDKEIYYWSVGGGEAEEMHTLAPNGGSYSEPWQSPESGGVSIKMATEPDKSNILQFEYTVSQSLIFWDISAVDMQSSSVFTKTGFGVKPSKPGGNCPTAVCHAGDSSCSQIYLQPKDDHATHGCPIDTHFEMEIGQ